MNTQIWKHFFRFLLSLLVLMSVYSCSKIPHIDLDFNNIENSNSQTPGLYFSWQPTSAEQGVIINPEIKVEFRDSSGQVDTSFTNNVILAFSTTGNPNGATLGGTLIVTAINGVATFNDISINNSHDYYQLTATSGIYLATSSRFSIYPSTPIFRSVGPGNNTTLATSSGNGLTISGATAEFGNSLPLNIGVGDVIIYNTGIDIAFIHGRSNETTYQVRNVSGGNPNAIVSDNTWEIYRAYDSLFDAERGAENTGIPAGVRDFDMWTDNKDIVASGEVWNIACYGDAQDDNGAFITYISGWTTAVNNYIKAFTPIYLSEVGVSQRHNGIWNNSAYSIKGTDLNTLIIVDDYVKIVGFQIETELTVAGNRNPLGITSSSNGIVEINSNIIKNTNTNTNTGFCISIDAAGGVNVYNNIIYDCTNDASAGTGIRINNAGLTAYIYNNTIYNTYVGAIRVLNGDVTAINNIAYSNTNNNNYIGAYNANSNYNISDDVTSTGGGNDQVSASVNFIDELGSPRDLHLHTSDTNARNSGQDLSSDISLSFFVDIDDLIRSSNWDIGADQF